MLDRIYCEKGKQDVFLNRDDFQVYTKLMLGASMVTDALDEMRKRGTFDVMLEHCGKAGEQLLKNYMKECGEDFEEHRIYNTSAYKYSRIGQIAYDTMLGLRDKAEDF